MLFFKFLYDAIRSVGPICILAIVIWGTFVFRSCCRMWGNHDHFAGSMTSVIEEIRSVNKLKVLRVVDAGLDTYPDQHNVLARKNGYVDFQYSGVVDLYVDLSKMTVTPSSSNTYVVVLDRIEMSKVRDLSLTRDISIPESDKLLVETYRKFYGKKSVQDDLHSKFSEIQALSIQKSASREDNAVRARKQAERLLRYMFAPFVNNADTDVSFQWKEYKINSQHK